jgi:hypothetical protein
MRRGLPLVLALGACRPDWVLVVGPDAPGTADTLSARLEGPEPAAVTWRWSVDGEPTDVAGPEVDPSRTTRGETWTVVASIHDGGRSEEFEASVTVVNTPPSAEVSLTPDPARPADDLVAAATATDADGDPVSLAYRWSVDGERVADTGATLPADRTASGEAWTVVVVPDDGLETGAEATDSVEVVNTHPEVVGGVTLTPTAPTALDTLVAAASVTDADGDPTSIQWTWLVDGTAAKGWTGDTFPAAEAGKHAVVVARATPFDGQETGTAVDSEPVTVANTAPTFDTLAISPAPLTSAERSCRVRPPRTTARPTAPRSPPSTWWWPTACRSAPRPRSSRRTRCSAATTWCARAPPTRSTPTATRSPTRSPGSPTASRGRARPPPPPSPATRYRPG